MTPDLFDELPPEEEPISMAPGAILLRGFARSDALALVAAFHDVTARAPLRHLVTPGGHVMSVAITNCGEVGWVSDRRGYRYSAIDPLSGHAWPPVPVAWMALAKRAAAQAGYQNHRPDACLVNQYLPGSKLTLHQDRDEADMSHPIVSVSLGLPAVFLFGTEARTYRPARYRLTHGDVVVWGGAARLAFHGIAPLAEGHHPLLGRQRINLTFRCAR